MANNVDRINCYIVVFDHRYVPGEDIEDVRTVTIEMYAKSVDDAKDKALKTVTLNPEKYDIVLIKNKSCRAANAAICNEY